MEEHLGELFTEDGSPDTEQEEDFVTANDRDEPPMAELHELPSAEDEALLAHNAARDDWISRISRNGRHRREQKGVWYRRKADFLASETDPDSSPMKRRESKGSHLGYYAHYG